MGQRLQNTVPSIMQVRSEEKPIFSSPKVNSNILSAVVSVTAAMSRMTRLRLEWKYFSTRSRPQPSRPPSTTEQTISIRGFTMMEMKLSEPP